MSTQLQTPKENHTASDLYLATLQHNMSRNVYGNLQPGIGGQNLASSQIYHHIPNQATHDHASVDTLAENLGNINIYNNPLVGHGKTGQIDSALLGQQPMGSMLYQLADGSFAHGSYQQYPNQFSFSLAQPGQHFAHNGLPNASVPSIPHTPRNSTWVAPQSMHQIPELLAPRRSSWSSNEDGSPQTPLDGCQPTTLLNHSPMTWNTNPPPIQSQYPYNQQVAKDRDGVPVYADFWTWTQQEPLIPPPVPAMHSGPDGGRGSLDKILDNRNGTTNVYIRGLQPNTTDEMLGEYGRRFGPIVSQKAIVEMSNPKLCKGYGFILYHNYVDAENCIRAFFFLGYEAKFAKESHNQRLKALSDKNNTNLYVSNLPRFMIEESLENLISDAFPFDKFPDYKPTSTKILKDGNGISRGVGFARFQTPAVCEQIIDKLNNKDVGEGKAAANLQIRYADTEEQKTLKKYTAEKRQFKTNEYNEAAYGPGSPWRRLYSPMSNSTSTFSPAEIRAANSTAPWSMQSQASSISPPFASYSHAYQHSTLGYGEVADGSRKHASPAQTDATGVANSVPARVKIESPSVAAAAKKVAAEVAVVDEECSSASDEETLVCKSKSSKSYATDFVSSPTKSKL